MELKTLEDALNYLYSLDKIIMPPQFTYFNHCTSFQAEALQRNMVLKKSWTQIPIDGFVVRKEMSFTERNQRIETALGYGGKERASTTYGVPRGAKAFIIRVIMPKKDLRKEDQDKLGFDEEYIRVLKQEYMGLGDMRHPKLRNGEHILMFASSTVDEVSGETIDILYGIREQDIIRYANTVREVLSVQDTFLECDIPTPKKVSGQAYYEWDHNYRFNRETYYIPRDKTFDRYIRKGVLGPSGEVVLYQVSPFEQEYLDGLKESYTNSVVEPVASTTHHK